MSENTALTQTGALPGVQLKSLYDIAIYLDNTQFSDIEQVWRIIHSLWIFVLEKAVNPKQSKRDPNTK